MEATSVSRDAVSIPSLALSVFEALLLHQCFLLLELSNCSGSVPCNCQISWPSWLFRDSAECKRTRDGSAGSCLPSTCTSVCGLTEEPRRCEAEIGRPWWPLVRLRILPTCSIALSRTTDKARHSISQSLISGSPMYTLPFKTFKRACPYDLVTISRLAGVIAARGLWWANQEPSPWTEDVSSGSLFGVLAFRERV